MVEYTVAIGVTRVRFPDDAFFIFLSVLIVYGSKLEISNEKSGKKQMQKMRDAMAFVDPTNASKAYKNGAREEQGGEEQFEFEIANENDSMVNRSRKVRSGSIVSTNSGGDASTNASMSVASNNGAKRTTNVARTARTMAMQKNGLMNGTHIIYEGVMSLNESVRPSKVSFRTTHCARVNNHKFSIFRRTRISKHVFKNITTDQHYYN